QVIKTTMFRPRRLCASCGSATYEGAPVRPSAPLQALVDAADAAVAARRDEALGVVLRQPMARSHDGESALGNFVAHPPLARHHADVAILNTGGLSADLPPGPLTYGALYEAFPFADRATTIELPAGQLARILAKRLQRGTAAMAIAGARVVARCEGP